MDSGVSGRDIRTYEMMMSFFVTVWASDRFASLVGKSDCFLEVPPALTVHLRMGCWWEVGGNV